jgi:tetratricopeptide (TPR) repeat protein
MVFLEPKMLKFFATVCVSLLFLSGCGRDGMSKSQLQSAQEAAEKAAELEKTGSFKEALPLIDKAISQGGLNPDQLSEAYLLRARCNCDGGNLEQAEKDIAMAEQGSPNPSSWHYSRAILFAKKNKISESKAEFSKAQKIDPKLKMPN